MSLLLLLLLLFSLSSLHALILAMEENVKSNLGDRVLIETLSLMLLSLETLFLLVVLLLFLTCLFPVMVFFVLVRKFVVDVPVCFPKEANRLVVVAVVGLVLVVLVQIVSFCCCVEIGTDYMRVTS